MLYVVTNVLPEDEKIITLRQKMSCELMEELKVVIGIAQNVCYHAKV